MWYSVADTRKRDKSGHTHRKACYNGPFMEWKPDVTVTLFFCSFREERLPGRPRVKRTVLLLRGKKKSMKSPYLAIRILQHPNMFKSKTLPPEWGHGRSENLQLSRWAFRKSRILKWRPQHMQLPLKFWIIQTGSALRAKDTVSLFALNQGQRWYHWQRL